jgi:aquaporin Z
MVSACFFGALLEAKNSALHLAIHSSFVRTIIMGVLMGATALFIFYSSWTSPSGSHINPAVTLSFLRIGKMCPWDVLFFILFQIAGGVSAVYLMQLILGGKLVSPPVNSVTTVPVGGNLLALMTEFLIAFITMAMVIFTSHHEKFKKYTRIIAGCLVCTWVIVAGPISGFGMNPARSFASALPANIWTAFWIYLFVPFAGMLSATEIFLFIRKNKK